MDVKAKQFAGIPDSLLQKERRLTAALAFYDEKIFKEQEREEISDSAKINLWHNKIFKLNWEYESLIKKFESDYPEHYHLKYQTNIIPPHKVQEKIVDRNSALLEYFLGKESIFIFTLTKDHFDLTAVAKDTLFEKQIDLLRTGLIKKEYFLYTNNSSRLYQLLISPIEQKISNKNLIIIPGGMLGYVPFETLLTEDVKESQNDYHTLPYLIKNHQISYHYSCSLLSENMNREKKGNHGINYLGFAPVIFNQ